MDNEFHHVPSYAIDDTEQFAKFLANLRLRSGMPEVAIYEILWPYPHKPRLWELKRLLDADCCRNGRMLKDYFGRQWHFTQDDAEEATT